MDQSPDNAVQLETVFETGMPNSPAGEPRRLLADRRRRPTPMFSRYTFSGGRRRASRRAEDSRAIYVDRLGQGISLALVGIFFFHCLDAMFTLAHLARGGRELNPLMDALIQVGPSVFVSAKLAIAGIGLLFLGIHKNFPLVRQGIAGLFVLYAGVIGYHFLLFWQS